MKYFGKYPVTDDGSALSYRTGKPISFCNNGKGYLISRLYVDGKPKTVAQHVAVAEAFYGPCPEGYEVGHKDDNRANNHPSNLEYVTKSQNNKQSYDRGNRSSKGTNNANSKYTVEQLERACEMLFSTTKPNISGIARELGIGRGTLSKLYNGTQWADISDKFRSVQRLEKGHTTSV